MRVAIIAANGGMFDAYKVFNIATAAAATDAEVGIFFTFEGLNLIHKEAHKNLPMPAGTLISYFKKLYHFQYTFLERDGIPFENEGQDMIL
jgi:peroxiredoxin family protein